MDQTASANQELLRYVAKCCENSNLDSDIDLCSGRHNEKTATDRFALYTILQILSITLFEKMPILQALTANGYRNKITSGHMQLKLFES
jgi:hypothetical protein